MNKYTTLPKLNCSVILTLDMSHPAYARIGSKKLQYTVWYSISTIALNFNGKN